MAAITGAGAGSGLPLEDIITASLNAKRTQFERQIVTRETLTKTSLSGVGQLKSAISDFLTATKKLSETGAFNLRSVTITQPEKDPILKVESRSGTSNGSYNIKVNQLAAGSRVESADGSFSSGDQVIATADGTLTFSANGKSFEVNVKAGDTLLSLRKQINENSNNFGVTANIINLDGESKLILESKETGAGNDLQISASTAELKIFDTADVGSQMTLKTAARDASIDIDGVNVTSKTNTYSNAIQDLTITLLREGDKDSNGVTQANKVSVSTDTKGVEDKLNGFVKAYNTLLDKMDALGKRPTIVGGERQDDGGALSGDSTLRSIQDFMFNTLSSKVVPDGSYSSVYDMGFKMDNKGRLSIDSSKLSTVMSTGFEQIQAWFGGSEGLAAQFVNGMEDYTKTGGTLAKREDILNTDMRDIRDKRATFEANMVTYEKSLRSQYGNLDALLVKLNKSAQSLSALSYY